MANFWWQKLFLPEKAIFASLVFTMEKTVFPLSGKNLPTLHIMATCLMETAGFLCDS